MSCLQFGHQTFQLAHRHKMHNELDNTQQKCGLISVARFF